MKKGFSLNTNLGSDAIEEIGKKIFSENIYQAIEIRYIKDMVVGNFKDYDKGIKILKRDYNVDISMHLDHGSEIGINSVSVRNQIIEILKRSLDYGLELGCEIFVLHPVDIGILSYTDDLTNEYDRETYKIYLNKRKRAEEQTKELLRELSGYLGKSKAFVCLENVISKNNAVIRAEELKRVVKDVNMSNIKATFDIAHSFVIKEDIKEFIKLLGNDLYHVHISNNYGKCDNHALLDEGIIDIKEAIKALKDINYDKIIVVESLYKGTEGLKRCASVLDKYI